MTAAPNREPDHAARYGGLPAMPWQNAIEWAGHDIGDPLPEGYVIPPNGWVPSRAELMGLVGDLLAAHCPDGYAINEQRLMSFNSGEHRHWSGAAADGMVRIKIVNGS